MVSDKDSVIIAVQEPSPDSILMGDAATEEQCEQKKERNENNSCVKTTAAVEGKETKNPGSVDLGDVLPICMGCVIIWYVCVYVSFRCSTRL